MDSTRHSRHWLAFSLRTTGIVVAILALAFTWIRKEMTGELIRESDTGRSIPFYNGNTKPGTGLPDSLSLNDLTTRVLSVLDQEVPNHPFNRKDFHFHNLQRDVYGRMITYDFNKWVRRRLDIRALKYVFDVHDPVARSRNGQVHKAITDAVNMNRSEPENVPAETLPVDPNAKDTILRGLSTNTSWPRSGVTYGVLPRSGVTESNTVQQFTPSAREVTAVPTVGRIETRGLKNIRMVQS